MTLRYALPSYKLHTLLAPNRRVAVQRTATASRRAEAHASSYEGASRSGGAATQVRTGCGTPPSNAVIQHSSNMEQ